MCLKKGNYFTTTIKQQQINDKIYMMNTEHIDKSFNINSTHSYKSTKSSFKISTWTINGFTGWKRTHNDFIKLINYNDITCLVELWLGNKESELIKQDYCDRFNIFYRCREKTDK